MYLTFISNAWKIAANEYNIVLQYLANCKIYHVVFCKKNSIGLNVLFPLQILFECDLNVMIGSNDVFFSAQQKNTLQLAAKQ